MIRPISELQNEIRKIILKEYDNVNLKRTCNDFFIRKGFNPKDITNLFNENKFIEELDEMKLICLSKAFYRFFSNNEKLNPKKYFSDLTLENYKNYIITTKNVDMIKIHNVLRINDEEYIGILNYEEVYNYMNASMINYNINAQRQPTYKKIGDKYVAIPTIDNKTVEDIAETVIRGKLESTQVIFGYIIDDINVPKIKFNGLFENVGDLICEEILSVLDGYHRLSGISLAVARHLAETGKILNGYITFKILISDLERARMNVVQSFKRASTSKEYLRSITDDDKNNMLNKIINNSKILKENVSLTFEECKYTNSITYRTLLLDIINKMDIDFSNMSEVLIKSKKIAEAYDTIYDFIKTDNIALRGVFLYFAYRIVEMNKNEINVYYELADIIKDITEEQTKNWGLTHKNIKLNLIIDYFNKHLFDKEER